MYDVYVNSSIVNKRMKELRSEGKKIHKHRLYSNKSHLKEASIERSPKK